MSAYTFRNYQTQAINAGLQRKNGILVLPTGSGKSLVIAGLVKSFSGDTLILQPSREILESNFAKILAHGFQDVDIFSASLNRKSIGKATYATIGSIINVLERFAHIKNLIIDECHLVNAKGGMYEKLIKTLKPEKVIGLTATPYRLHTTRWGSSMRILTRTRPKLFKDVLYVVNPFELYQGGFLMKPTFIELPMTGSSKLKVNSTGADFVEKSLNAYYEHSSIRQRILELMEEIDQGLALKHILVFVPSVAESEELVKSLLNAGYTASEISAKTPERDRAQRLKQFASGQIRIMVNVGTLTTGYDFPALDCIIDARPTLSVALHYQKIGRVVRPYPDKQPHVFDLAGNYARFGNPINYALMKNARDLFDLYSDKGRLTTRIMTVTPECETFVSFGKHEGEKVRDLEDGYLHWCIENLGNKEWVESFHAEVLRRRIVANNKKMAA